MPSRTIRSFSDPDEFSDALRQWYGTEIVVTPKVELTLSNRTRDGLGKDVLPG
jgi:hypothetical protein